MRFLSCCLRANRFARSGCCTVLVLVTCFSFLATAHVYGGPIWNSHNQARSLKRGADSIDQAPAGQYDPTQMMETKILASSSPVLSKADTSVGSEGGFVQADSGIDGSYAETGVQAMSQTSAFDYYSYLPFVSRGSVDNPAYVGGFRVASSGSNVPDCGGSASPCRSIQYAANIAQSGDTILVAEGVYTYGPEDDVCLDPLGTTAVVCVFNKELTILGGYASGDWSGADPAANVTVIDGQGGHRGVLALGTDSFSAGLQMEGFTVQNGRARGVPTRSGNDQTFAFGGGMLVERSQAVLRDIIFRDNSAIGDDTGSAYGGSGSGGGLALRNAPSEVILENVTFLENRAEGGTGPERGGLGLGGGLFTYLAKVSGRDITFVGNVAAGGVSDGDGRSDGLHADAQGGGAAFQRGSAVTLRDVRATKNLAVGGDAPNGNPGGAFGGGFFTEDAVFALADAYVFDNKAEGGSGVNDGSTPGAGYARGGGIATTDTGFALDRATIACNTAQGGNAEIRVGSAAGGGVAAVRSMGDTLTRISNSIIAHNVAQIGGGAGDQVGGGGGGLWLQGTDADVIHTTLAQNSLGSPTMQGQAIVLLDFGMPTPTVADIAFSIIADHRNDFGAAAIHVQPGNTVNLNRGLFAGNTRNTNAGGVPASAGTINGLDSMLSAALAGFVSPGSPDYDYHILENSPAREQASDSTTPDDIDRNTRPFGIAPDIGADEYQP